MASDIQPDDYELEISKSSIDFMANAAIHRIVADVLDMRTMGRSQDTIRASITTDIANGRLGVGQLRSQINDETEKLQQRFLGQATSDEMNTLDDELLMWYSIGRNTCKDCIARHGTVQTDDEWNIDGQPAMGQTICRTKCQCKLVPVDIAATKIYGLPADTTPKQLTSRAKKDIVVRAKEIERISTARKNLKRDDFAQSTKLQMLGNFGASLENLPPKRLRSPQVLSPEYKRHLENLPEFRETGTVLEYESFDKTHRAAALAGIAKVDKQAP
jgi:hypothetical protein